MKTYNYLLEHGIKPSMQRIAIMDYLLTHKDHPSIDAIFMALSKKMPTLSKTTVYNTLKLFVENGAAQMLTIEEKNTCFDSETMLHSHFLCKKCSKIYDLPFYGEKNVEAFDFNGFIIEDIHHYYKGICPSCEAKSNKN